MLVVGSKSVFSELNARVNEVFCDLPSVRHVLLSHA